MTAPANRKDEKMALPIVFCPVMFPSNNSTTQNAGRLSHDKAPLVPTNYTLL